MKMNYSIYHVEQYGHGKRESNSLADDKKVTIADHDGHYDVYECESDKEAESIASWYVSAVYEASPHEVELTKVSARLFAVEVVDNG